MSLLVELVRALVGRPPPRRPPGAVFSAGANPLRTDDGLAARQEAALKLMDDDCYGFLLLTVHREDELRGRVELAVRMEPGYWPAANATLERVIAEIR